MGPPLYVWSERWVIRCVSVVEFYLGLVGMKDTWLITANRISLADLSLGKLLIRKRQWRTTVARLKKGREQALIALLWQGSGRKTLTHTLKENRAQYPCLLHHWLKCLSVFSQHFPVWATVNGCPEGLRVNTEGNYISYVNSKPKDLCWVTQNFPNEQAFRFKD